jgi:superfamily II DNA or RNA helicase
MLREIQVHMEQEWQDAQRLTHEWVRNYKKTYQPMTFSREVNNIQEQTLTDKGIAYITPNKMQKMALNNLKELRETGAKKGLVISATGTGKTYLSAFDVLQAKPKRVLFIVHREQILNKAKSDYQKIIGGNKENFGILSGNKKEISANYLFATIQTISKDLVLQQFAKDHFDYILIDEVHKAGAQSYHKILAYFQPDFLLGMTATPERTDGFNVFELFDYNIAYEIRL